MQAGQYRLRLHQGIREEWPLPKLLSVLTDTPPEQLQDVVDAASGEWGQRGETALMIAAKRGWMPFLVPLIAVGASLEYKNDTDKQTALFLAASAGQVDAARCLLEAGANPLALDSFESIPLHGAALRMHSDVASMLLDPDGTSANLVRRQIEHRDESQRTALHIACTSGCIETARLLIQRGANVNAANCQKERPLHTCALLGSPDRLQIARLLLENGANLGLKDLGGRTALAVARHAGNDNWYHDVLAMNDALAARRAIEDLHNPHLLPAGSNP